MWPFSHKKNCCCINGHKVSHNLVLNKTDWRPSDFYQALVYTNSRSEKLMRLRGECAECKAMIESGSKVRIEEQQIIDSLVQDINNTNQKVREFEVESAKWRSLYECEMTINRGKKCKPSTK